MDELAGNTEIDSAIAGLHVRSCADAMRRTKAASVFPHSPSSITGNEGD